MENLWIALTLALGVASGQATVQERKAAQPASQADKVVTTLPAPQQHPPMAKTVPASVKDNRSSATGVGSRGVKQQ